MDYFDGLFVGSVAAGMSQARHGETMGSIASGQAREARSKGERTQFELDRLYMITEALWEILKRQTGFTDEVLVEMIREIDLRDGVEDGKISRKAEKVTCTGCGRNVVQRQAKCLYCGTAIPVKPFVK